MYFVDAPKFRDGQFPPCDTNSTPLSAGAAFYLAITQIATTSDLKTWYHLMAAISSLLRAYGCHP